MEKEPFVDDETDRERAQSKGEERAGWKTEYYKGV